MEASSSENREIVAVAEKEDESRLTLRFDLHLSPRADWPSDEALLTDEARAQYLESTSDIPATCDLVADTLQQLQEEPAEQRELIDRLFEHCRTRIEREDDAPSDVEEALAERVASPLGRARAMVALCRAAGHRGPLYKCSIYGNEQSGAKLRALLEMGASRPWQDALAALSGERKGDAGALLEYFAPLRKWLREQIRDEVCGW